MKKFLVSLMMFLLVSFIPFGAAFAIPYTSTLIFDGEVKYPGDFNQPGIYGYVNYDFEIDIPPWEQVCDWTLDVSFYAEGSYNLGNSDVPITIDYDESFDLGQFPLIDYQSDIFFVIDFIEDMENPWYESDIGFYTLDGDWDDGTLWFGIFVDLEEEWGLTSAQVAFGGELALNANPVPEPATMLLFGSGLIGLAAFGRKKLFKKA